jgi:hypothetical protein
MKIGNPMSKFEGKRRKTKEQLLHVIEKYKESKDIVVLG